MQLYKKRDFGELFNDTFAFIRQNGKHFFGNYFKLIGIPLVILIFVTYFFMRYYMSFINNIVENSTSQNFGVDVLMPGGIAAFGGLALLFFIVMMIIGAVSYSYTPVYMSLYNQYNQDFTSKDIWATIKKRAGKIAVFFLLMIPVGILLGIVLGIGAVILAVTIIGILAIPIWIGFIALSVHTAFMEYINTESDYMESMSFGFSIIRKNFWTTVGNATLTYFLISIVVGLITSIPYYIYMFTQMATGTNPEEQVMKITGVTVVFYTISMIVSFLTNVIVQINMALIYYSVVEKDNNVSAFDEIEQIGERKYTN